MRAIAILCAFSAACGFEPAVDAGDGGTGSTTVSFLAETTLQDEASGDITVPVVLSAASAEPVTVNFAFSGGSATPGTDYTGSNGQLSFAPGQTMALIALTIVADSLEEPSETIEITLSSPSGAKLGTDRHTITISSDILPRVGFMALTSADAESVSPTVMLVLDSPAPAGVSVDFALTGSATAGRDYNLTGGTIPIPAGATSVPIALPVVDDPNDEDDEHAIFNLTSSSGVVVDAAKGSHDHTIVDNDAEPTISFALATRTESETDSILPYNLEVRLSVASGKTVRVSFGSNGASTATEGSDYNYFAIPLTPKTLVFDPDETSKDVGILLREDNTDEDDETIVIELSNLMNATAGGTMQHVFTIQDDDATPTVSWGSPGSIRANENDQTDVTYTYNLGLSRPSSKTIEVPISIGGSATLNSDYTLLDANPVVFSPGQVTRQFRVRVNADNSPEPDETVVMTIGTPTNAVNGGSNQTRTHTIDNDDGGGGGGGG